MIPVTVYDPPEIMVRNGAEVLDEKKPGWHKEVAVDELEILCSNYCILGQVYGHYVDGLDALGIDMDESWMYGFYGPHGGGPPGYYDELEELWVKEITERRIKDAENEHVAVGS